MMQHWVFGLGIVNHNISDRRKIIGDLENTIV